MSEEIKEPKKKGSKKAALIVAGSLSFLMVAGALGVGITSLVLNQSQNKKVNEFIAYQKEKDAEEQKKENEYMEDGFVVGESYEIRSTTNISDAYKNGDPSSLTGEDKETYDMAKAVIDEVIKDGMSDYEKEKAIYDWMYKNIGQGSGSVIQMPGQQSSAFTPYGVLKSKNAVCVGYATTFRLFMNMLGMDVHIVHNDYHSWDEVKLDDGEWYQLDIYSDVSSQSKYRNFNMTDDMARTGHDWDGSSLPEAKGIKYSYAMQAAKEVKDLYEIPKKIRKAMDKQKSVSMYFKFPKKLEDKDIALANAMISQCQQSLYSVDGGGSYDLSASFAPDMNDSYILGVFLTNYNSGSSDAAGDADKKELEKMTQIINELFNGAQGTDDGQTDPDGKNSGDMIPEDAVSQTNAETTAAVDDIVTETLPNENVIIGGGNGVATFEIQN